MPDDRTPDERAAGFDYDATTDAVVYQLSPTERVTKLSDPTGSVVYPVQQHGRLPFEPSTAPNRWLPIHSGIPIAPAEAITRAKRLVAGPPEQQVVVATP